MRRAESMVVSLLAVTVSVGEAAKDDQPARNVDPGKPVAAFDELKSDGVKEVIFADRHPGRDPQGHAIDVCQTDQEYLESMWHKSGNGSPLPVERNRNQ